MSWLEIEGQPVKVWKASVIDTTTKAAPGTILEANKQGIQVATGDGILNLLSMQPAGKKAMSVQDLLNSRRGMVCTGQPSGLIVHSSKPGLTGHLYILMKKQRNLRSMAAQAIEQVVEQGQSLSNILPPLNKSFR